MGLERCIWEAWRSRSQQHLHRLGQPGHFDDRLDAPETLEAQNKPSRPAEFRRRDLPLRHVAKTEKLAHQYLSQQKHLTVGYSWCHGPTHRGSRQLSSRLSSHYRELYLTNRRRHQSEHVHISWNYLCASSNINEQEYLPIDDTELACDSWSKQWYKLTLAHQYLQRCSESEVLEHQRLSPAWRSESLCWGCLCWAWSERWIEQNHEFGLTWDYLGRCMRKDSWIGGVDRSINEWALQRGWGEG